MLPEYNGGHFHAKIEVMGKSKLKASCELLSLENTFLWFNILPSRTAREGVPPSQTPVIMGLPYALLGRSWAPKALGGSCLAS